MVRPDWDVFSAQYQPLDEGHADPATYFIRRLTLDSKPHLIAKQGTGLERRNFYINMI